MDVRVRLVFADDVGRHVQRRRGFSSCWYLISRDAKLVGDLAHALLQEFGLRKRCPRGLELLLEDLPVLATQSIRIVRDNDTIVVQCPPLDEKAGSVTSSEEDEVETLKRKRKLRRKEQPKKKLKTVKLGKKVKNGQCSSGNDGRNAAKTVGRKKVETSDSSSESDTSSSESSSESSSSSDSEEERAVQQQLKNTSAATTRTQGPGNSNGVAKGATNKSKAVERNGKEPRKRRRRLRQRSGGRQRNGNQANGTGNSSNQTPLSGDDRAPRGQIQMRTAPARTNQMSLSGKRHGDSITVDPRGFPRAKSHVIFDEVSGDRVVVQHDEHKSSENNRLPQDPELAKYGPSSSGSQRSGSRHDQTASSVSLTSDKDEGASDINCIPKRKGKDKYEERWKRPYEIVATVLDKKSVEASSSIPDLTQLLGSYPTAPTASHSFEPKDIIAFKTLTLCLETWQPVVSEWKCGQVRSVAGSGIAIELSTWTLEASGDSVNFHETPNSEQIDVQTSEISEVRFLSGPSYTTLGQTAPQAN